MTQTRTHSRPLAFALVALIVGVAAAIVLKPDASVKAALERPFGFVSIGDARGGGFGAADGYVGDDYLDVWADLPALNKLQPDLREAVRAAAADAAADGVELKVTSGWRSAAFQQYLLDEAVAKYGSYEEARRWVSTPTGSRHVTGEAVDIGPTDAADWTIRHGSDHGLCQVFANEMWHFELLTTPGGECPALRPDGSS
ncbi:M15 family metallopeptidase [Kineosporia babensis]|uniref:M15 family metallopeptidase n=1 Tax=Kineosporia babensis TaxID=499548 RepID=A0A9X1SV58_9ACTN|nr:M15 family metallopeptidase [Kineosporia babensis]MCD5313256.1 M15 family metallopeptidase [Kineosporia babensis]